MRIIMGKTGSGKTAAIIEEIKQFVRQRRGRIILLVPEQYTHEAERELSAACGDTLSLYGEVLSFTGLARLAAQQFGDSAGLRIDDAGRMLCLNYALHEIGLSLRLFSGAAHQTDTQCMLLQELKALRTASVSSDQLRFVAENLAEDHIILRKKLKELALIMDASDAVLKNGGAAADDPLAVLKNQIEQFGLPGVEHIYVDGFIDFTGLEQNVLRAIISQNIPLTVCMTGTDQKRKEEQFLPSTIAIEQLKNAAAEYSVPVQMQYLQDREDTMLQHFSEHIFDYTASVSEIEYTNAIRIVCADNPQEECEAAAAEVLRLVREQGSRWRDIAIAVRGYKDYRCLLEETFRRYEVPLFTATRDPINEKAVPHWIHTAYEIVLGNWDADDLIEWIGCGFCGLTEEESDMLTAYIYKWKLKKRAWIQSEPWAQHPDGYGAVFDSQAEARLRQINSARFQVAKPLLFLQKRVGEALTVREQTVALNEFLKEINFIQRLNERVDKLNASGERELAAEYCQIWEICINALEQTSAILGDTQMDAGEFQKLFEAVLSHYDIGLIPISLDRVSAGDFDRMRRRNIKHLLVLGCSDDRLPGYFPEQGIFTEAERDQLSEYIQTIGSGELAQWKEYALIYHTFSLPSESMWLSYSTGGFRGEQCLPSFLLAQAEKLYNLKIETIRLANVRLSAEKPALALAAGADRSGASPEAKAAQAWFLAEDKSTLLSLREIARAGRGSLSAYAVRALYGKTFRISHSRMNVFSECHFAYYCKYGLKAKEWETAEYRPPEIGTFLHSVLEKTGREVMKLGGFTAVSDELLRNITKKYTEEYFRIELQNGREKSARFLYLYQRLCEDAVRIVQDTADELRNSDFQPVDFEFNFSGIDSEDEINLSGVADRIDGWIHDDRLYLRVVDYKTGKKSFSLSDVCYGRDLQLLLYLFTLCDHSEELFQRKSVPAGVVYQPAKAGVLPFAENPSPENEAKERRKERRRSGLVLDDPALLHAWDNGGERAYIPVKIRGTDPLVNMEQMGILRRQVDSSLKEMRDELQKGNIDANPLSTSEVESVCDRCPYHTICRFEEGKNGEHRRLLPKLNDEEAWKQMEKVRP